jgi:hypothetical protein
VLRASLKVNPWPMVWVIRRQFADTGKPHAASLRAQAPADVFPVIDERYDDDPDARFDVYRPGSAVRAGRRLPTVVGPTAVGSWAEQGRDRRLPADDRGRRYHSEAAVGDDPRTRDPGTS